MTEWGQNVATLRANPPGADAAERLTAIVRARALDDDDAELLLDALGLNGRVVPVGSGTMATMAMAVHGTQSGVDAHTAAGHQALCRACERFLQVREGAERACSDLCGTVRGYWRHRARKEPTCERSRAAYRVYNQRYEARKRQAR